MKRYLSCLCSIAILLAGCGSSSEPGNKPDSASTLLTGTVTFVCGEVQLLLSNEETPVDIGMNVPENSTIETGPDSTCEIQFDDYGSVQLSPGTIFTVSTLARDKARTETEMSLDVGSVVCKVRKLSGDDRFMIRTRTIVAGVRGTVFLVASDGASTAKVAVSEGVVALAPASIVTATPSPAADGRIEVSGKILSVMPVLKAGEEIALNDESMKKVDRIVRDIFDDIPEGEKTIPAHVAEKIKEAEDEMNVVGKSVKPLTTPTRSLFDSAANLKIREFDQKDSSGLKDSTETGCNETVKQTDKELASLVVNVDPPDSTVLVNGVILSRGAFRGLFSPEETVDLMVTRDGFADFHEVIAMTESAAITRYVKLAADTTTPENTVVVEQPAIHTIPVSSGKIMALCTSKNGNLIASDAAANVFLISPSGNVLWNSPTGNGTNANSPAIAGDGVIAYAGDRQLTVFDEQTGNILWQMALGKGNSGLFGRKPVITGTKLYFSSDHGIVCHDIKTGNQEKHIIIDGGSDMSPACANGSLYIASTSGTFHAIDPTSMTDTGTVQTDALQPVANAPVIVNDTAIIADRRGLVLAISLKSLTVDWQTRLDPATSVEVFSDLVATDTTVYITGKNKLHGLSIADGTKAFAPIPDMTTQPCLAKGYLWCGSDSYLVKIEPSTGTIVDTISLSGRASGRPVCIGNSLYIPLSNGSIDSMQF